MANFIFNQKTPKGVPNLFHPLNAYGKGKGTEKKKPKRFEKTNKINKRGRRYAIVSGNRLST